MLINLSTLNSVIQYVLHNIHMTYTILEMCFPKILHETIISLLTLLLMNFKSKKPKKIYIF